MKKKSFHNWLIIVVLLFGFSSVSACPKHLYVFDSLPMQSNQKIVIVPFEYKQSALYQLITFKIIDSVLNTLLKGDSITLSIEGYAHVDEGSDSICYYLSLNRAMVVKNYILGRGIDSTRIASIKGFGNLRSAHLKETKKVFEYNCRAEIILHYPLPPPPVEILDMDGDGIPDAEDGCPTQYGSKINNGCPDKNAIIVPFTEQQSYLTSSSFNKLDSIIDILIKNPAYTIVIEGYAHKNEGSQEACNQLAKDRAEITKSYFLSRNISASRIDAVKSFGTENPITASRNFWEITQNCRVQVFLNVHQAAN